MSSLSVAGYSGMHVAHEPEIRYALDIKIECCSSLKYTQWAQVFLRTTPYLQGCILEFMSLKEVRKTAGLLAK